MKLTEARIDRALDQLNAQAVPENHPVMAQLSRLFGDHTFFLDASGLCIIEPAKLDGKLDGDGMAATAMGQATMGQVVQLADWIDETRTNLAPHEREYTETLVVLDRAA